MKLIDKCFPPGHPLRKIVNKNTVKVSYSCTPNMERIIASRNSKLLAAPPSAERTCNCPRNTPCPLDGKCLLENVVYEAKVTQDDQTQNFYTGLCSTTFKTRFGIHKNSFKNEEDNQTSLSKFIWSLKNKNLSYKLSWKLMDQATPFSPVSGNCALCTREKFYILFKPTSADLNSRNEIYNNCRHKIAVLLIKRERKRKKAPG